MASVASLTITCELSETMRIALGALELMAEAIELVPEWHTEERERLLAEARKLQTQIVAKLTVGSK